MDNNSNSLYNFKHTKEGNKLFFGDPVGTFDSVNRKYANLFNLYKEIKKRDWSETDVPLNNSYLDLQKASPSQYELMSKTLTWQLEGDSFISRADAVLFAPFITNSEYSQVLARIMDNEFLHSLTYSEIIKQCYDTPDDIFKEIEINKNIQDRSGIIMNTLCELERVGAKYRLGEFVDHEYLKDVIYKGLVAVYCLEKISFIASFAITFALAETQFCLEIGKLVQKIYIDESYHIRTREEVLRILREDERSEWGGVIERNKSWCKKFIDSVVEEELNWSEYIFSEDRIVLGLNTELLKEEVYYTSQDVYRNVGLDPIKTVESNPLPYMDNWLVIDNFQNANQETQNTNYLLNVIVDDAGEKVIDFEL